MTIGEHLIQVADAGLAMSEMATGEDTYTHLIVLLALEDALDKGRTSLGLSGSGVEHRTEIVEKMDELRSRIRSLIDQCDKEEFLEFMNTRGNLLKTQFGV